MEKTFPLEERSIRQIYFDSQEKFTYVIPIYQRNYAWEENEISALIEDVYNSFHKKSKVYYIGTLVTYKREDGKYEVIDGQQRLTTIHIILKALKIKDIRNKLTYSARKVSDYTIANLPDIGEDVDFGIKKGYDYADKAIEGHNFSDQAFSNYFLDNVHIIHYQVPKDVDLNHYFEVMNSRGEQLELHEIVKSTLGEKLDDAELTTFSRVWEACSEMNVYIQQMFAEVFDNNLNKLIINSFDEIPEQGNSDGKAKISALLEGKIDNLKDSADKEQNDKFQPIIDFPNFLLIVLKITLISNVDFDPLKFTLDDKELHDKFNKALQNADDQAKFTKDFVFNLLRAKYFLDNYIVHHTLNDKELQGDNPWKLQYYHRENAQKKYPKNLTDNQDVQIELEHLLSMFEVAFTPKQRKNYLFYCLMYLFDNKETTAEDYLKFLQNLADKYFYDVYLNRDCLNERNQPSPNAFDNAILKNNILNINAIGLDGTNYKQKFTEIYIQGRADVPLFVFNYTDYKLWKKYADELRGKGIKKGSKEREEFFEQLGCSDFGLDPFDNFYFSRTRKSLEHFYPQAKAGDGKILSAEAINCFGNFAMIGADANSSGSNLDPKAKLDHYNDSKYNQVSVASLKFKIMMQMCHDNEHNKRDKGMEWNEQDMQNHQTKMLNIIVKK